jgi:4-hydroxy-tetrahydrodipicolinate reductase
MEEVEMINVIINGANGRMGQVLSSIITETDDLKVVTGIDKFPDFRQNSFPVYLSLENSSENADMIIDFSRPEALPANLSFAKQNKIPMVIATTGFSFEEKKQIYEAAKNIPIFFAANMSLGVNLQMELAKSAAAFLGEAYDIEIIEKHHNQKVDAPSGTALAIADFINEAFTDPKEYVYGRHSKTEKRGREIGIHAVRGGTVPGEHSVMFIGTDEIIEINHIAQSRQIFAFGAVRAARFLFGKPAGLYSMSDIIAESAVTHIYQDDGQAMATLTHMPFSPSLIAQVFDDIAKKNIKIDIITQTSPHDGKVNLSFSMPISDINDCSKLLKKYITGDTKINTDTKLSKLTIEGAGMQRQSGVASRLFASLAEKEIGIYIITTSETKISFCVDTAKVKDAVSAVSKAFYL